MSQWLIDWLSAVSPERRRLWAARLFMWGMACWPLTHAGLVFLPPEFFEHVMVALSVLAVLVTMVDIIQTSDVRAEQ